MRRLRVIVALGALLRVLGGVVTASPALAGRGPKWQPPLTGRARLVLIILAALIGFGTPALTATARQRRNNARLHIHRR